MTAPDSLEELRQANSKLQLKPGTLGARVLAAWEKERAERSGDAEGFAEKVDQLTALRAAVLKVAEEMDGLPKAVEYASSMGTAVITGPYAEWAARLRKAAE